jgi:hypothetical protein
MKLKYLPIIILICIGFLSCKKDKVQTPNEKIVGSWLNTRLLGNEFIAHNVSYEFGNDGTFISTIYSSDLKLRKILGYHQKTVGKYKINENKLELFDQITYRTNNYQPGSKEDLSVVVDAFPSASSFPISFDTSRKSFFLQYPPCGPAALCIYTGDVEYVKK